MVGLPSSEAHGDDTEVLQCSGRETAASVLRRRLPTPSVSVQVDQTATAANATLEVTFDRGVTKHPVLLDQVRGRQRWRDMKKRTSASWHQGSRREAETQGSNLWRIHGKMYDLEPFMDKHPGGRRWLELTWGTDTTQALEAYHLDYQKVEATLEKYYARDVAEGEFEHGDRFSFHDAGFYRTLRRRVFAKLKTDAGSGASTQQATGPPRSMRLAAVVVLVQFLLAQCYACAHGSFVAAVLAGLFSVGCWGVGHNFMHQSESKAGFWRYAMDVVANHSRSWQVSHGLSHHLDTNLKTDYEQTFFFIAEYEEILNRNVTILFFPFIAPGRAMKDILSYIVEVLVEVASTNALADRRRWCDVLAGCLPVLPVLGYILGAGAWQRGLALWASQQTTFFLAFVPLAAGVHHACPSPGSDEHAALGVSPQGRGTLAWTAGQEGEEADFGAHQLAASTDHCIFQESMPGFLRDYLSLTLFGYLNNHVLHHLFPGVDASRLMSCHRLLLDTATEFGLLEKNVQPVRSATVFIGYWRYMLKRSVVQKTNA